MKITTITTLKNKLGLHARPATKIVQIANQFQSKITIESPEGKADATSIMDLLILAVLCGTEIKITVEGENSKENELAMEKILHLINNQFHEE